jgi:nicotinamidase-related amidase
MSLNINARTAALVLIDLQNGILSMQLAPHDAAQVVEKAVKLGRRFREIGAPVVLTRVAFSNNYADKLNQLVDVPMQVPPRALPPEWSQFTGEIESLGADVVITKRQWSAFFGTELDLQLRRRGISTIVLGGVSTNFGVESTARDAWQYNYAVIVAEDASTSVGADLHKFSVDNLLPRVSRVRSTAEILSALSLE